MDVEFIGTEGENLLDYMLAKLNKIYEAFVVELKEEKRERPPDYMLANYDGIH